MFMYENTDARTHRVAAELIEAGVDVNEIFRRLYERVPEAKLKLIARALGRIDRRLDGALSTTYLSADDYAATGADETLTEGIIDFVRGIEGTSVAAVVRDKPDSQREARKVSLRSTDGSVDVSVIARKMGGGGHRAPPASRPTCSYDELVEFLSDETAAAARPVLRPPAPAEPAASCCDKPAGVTSHDVVARYRRELGGRRPATPGTLDPFATGLLIVLLGARDRAAALRARAAEDLRGHRPARLALDHRRPRRRADRDRARPRRGSSCRPAPSRSGSR